MQSPVPRPGPSKKRRVARGIAIASALAAGAALAGGFTLTQPGSASTSPDEAVGDGDLAVSDLVLDDLSSDPAQADRNRYDFTFTNTSDEDAHIAVQDIVFEAGDETDPSDEELYDSIVITLDDGIADNNPDGAAVDYEGPLAALAHGDPVSLGPVLAGSTLAIDVTAYTTIERNDDATELESRFAVTYHYASTAEEAAGAGGGQCDALAEGGAPPELVDACRQLEGAAGGGGGGQPSCDDLPEGTPPELAGACQDVVEALTGGDDPGGDPGGTPSCEDAPDPDLKTACKAILDALTGEGDPGGDPGGDSPSCQDIAENGGPQELADGCQTIVDMITEALEGGGGGGDAPSCADLPDGTPPELVTACEEIEGALPA